MNKVFIIGTIFWIIVMYLILCHFKSKYYEEMRRNNNYSGSSVVIVPLPIVDGIEVQNIPENSIIINGKQSDNLL